MPATHLGNGGRFQTCFWLEGAGESVLIDCGATSLTVLKTAGLEPNDIACAVLTHLHGDHFGGLPFLVLDGQFRRRDRPLAIAGPPGTRERVEAAMDLLFPGSRDAHRRFEITFIELAERQATTVGPAVVTTIPVEQPDTPACALRIEYGTRVVAYSGDTAWTDELIDVAANADLFVAEGPAASVLPQARRSGGTTQEHLDAVATELNGRPRKTLGWLTPAERFAELARERPSER